LVLKATYLHYFVVMEQTTELLVDLGQNLVFAPLLTIVLEIVAPWASFDIPIDQTFALTWDKLVVLDHI
jgi:hypothetical protein